MSRIERGQANPSLDAIEALAVALGVEVKTFFETADTGVLPKAAISISVPFASDGSCFNPSLRRTRTGKFTVGEKSNEVTLDTFEAAVEYLKTMETAYWRRPNKAGNWGRVVAVSWGALPKKHSTL
jgi:transcriptional regulator with XRE-family HTH domain